MKTARVGDPQPKETVAAEPVLSAYSSESNRRYTLDKLIGKGGFGEVYLATPTPREGLPAQVCIKITDRISAWLREAYFAELLGRETRPCACSTASPSSMGR